MYLIKLFFTKPHFHAKNILKNYCIFRNPDKNSLKFFASLFIIKCYNNRCMLVKLQFFDTTTDSPEVISDSALVDDLNEVKVEPEDFHDFSKNTSNENEVTPNSSESLQCFDIYSKNRTGEFESVI